MAVENTIKNISCPIKEIKIVRNALIYGEGPFLVIRLLNDGGRNCKLSHQIFNNDSIINGLEVTEDSEENDSIEKEKILRLKICTWAKNTLKIVSVRIKGQASFQCNVLLSKTLDYYPIEAKWTDHDEGIVVLSALNFFAKYSLREDAKPSFLEESWRVTGSPFNLFCGAISEQEEEFLLFSGSVLDGVLVWTVSKNDRHVKKLEALKGHNGIPFSLHYNAHQGILLSCSDDRFIIVWKLQADQSFVQQCKLLGHQARVWKAVLVQNEYVISVGESSEILVHNVKGDLLKKWIAHGSSPVYGCCYDFEVDVLYTSAHDGSIYKWEDWLSIHDKVVLPYDKPVFEGLQSNPRSQEDWSDNTNIALNDLPRSVLLYDTNYVLLAMDTGRIIGINRWMVQFPVFYHETLKGYSVIALSPTKQLLCLGGAQGHFHLLQMHFKNCNGSVFPLLASQKLFTKQLGSKLTSILWISDRRLLLCSPKEIIVLQLHLTSEDKVETEPLCSFQMVLKKPQVPCAVEVSVKYLVLGDEDGRLFLMKFGVSEPLCTLRDAHQDGIIDLVKDGDDIYSAGKDGVVNVLQILDNDNESVQLQVTSQMIIPLSWIGGLHRYKRSMLCVGFHKEDFIVYSLAEGRILASVNGCGQGLRRWSFELYEGFAALSFIRDKTVYYVPIHLEACQGVMVQSGLHAKTVNCAVSLPNKSIDFQDWTIVTGSEDGTIRVFSLQGEGQMILHEKLDKHSSSVRALAKFSDESKTILFSGGGRSELRAWCMERGKKSFLHAGQIVLPVSSQGSPNKNKQSINLAQADLRIMDICLVRNEKTSEEIICLCCCSDGTLKAVKFNEKTRSFKMMATFFGNGHTISRSRAYLSVSDSLTIFGATTNGELVIWNWGMTSSPDCIDTKPKYSKRIRKAALMCFDVAATLEQDKIIFQIIFGGDDCSISLWHLTWSDGKEDSYHIDLQCVEDQIQRSSVVGVYFVDGKVFACSNDQVLSSWSLTGELLGTMINGVTDCQGFLVRWDGDKKTAEGISFGNSVSLFHLKGA